MGKHKITAIKLTGLGDDAKLTAMMSSPRGTKAIVGSKAFKMDQKDRSKRRQNILAALNELLGNEE